jgi:hypothetical protein
MEENLLQMYENNAYAAVLKWLERLPFETLNKSPCSDFISGVR